MDRTRDLILGCEDEWPMRVRRVFYIMMGRGELPEVRRALLGGKTRTAAKLAQDQYKMVADDIARIRVLGEIPWDCIADTHRRMLEVYSQPDKSTYLRVEAFHFLTDYRREYFVHAPYYPELWVEKDAAATVFEELASELRIPLVILKGDSSITFVHDLAARARERMESRDQPTLLVYCSDLDPRGYFMLQNVMGSLHEDMGIEDQVVGVRAILTPEQVVEHHLPHNPDGVKKGDCRYSEYLELVGDYGVELDALDKGASHAAVLKVIAGYCGKTFLAKQQRIEKAERTEIDSIRDQVIDVIEEAI